MEVISGIYEVACDNAYFFFSCNLYSHLYLRWRRHGLTFAAFGVKSSNPAAGAMFQTPILVRYLKSSGIFSWALLQISTFIFHKSQTMITFITNTLRYEDRIYISAVTLLK